MKDRRNLTCLLPDTALGVEMWAPHPCGGYYLHEAWCYGPHGRIGYWVDSPGVSDTRWMEAARP